MDRQPLNRNRQIIGYRFVNFILLLFATLAPLHSTLAALPESRNELLQFVSGGHMLGFKSDGVYIAGGDHMLKIEFTGTSGVIPVTNKAVQTGFDKQALKYVTYNDLWPGIDLSYEATASGIVESTWQIAPGSTPGQIRLRYNAPVEIDSTGNLKISYETGWMRESAPIAWQQIDGRRIPVQVAFNIIKASNGQTAVGFDLGQYNPAHPLLIDPVLEWNTFLGSSEWDEGNAMALDASDNIYLTGVSTASWGSPVTAHPGGSGNAFVAKLDSSGALQWHTFLGSEESFDKGTGIAVDSAGNVYVIGTSSGTWGSPTVAHGGGGGDAFVAILDSEGNRTWNTFIGSEGYDEGNGIVLDSTTNIYVVGTKNGQAFATKINTNRFSVWSKYMGESTTLDKGLGIALDSSVNVYVVGESMRSWGAPLEAHPGDDNWPSVFAVKLNNSGAIQWNTFMGSVSTDNGGAISVDSSGNAYITGTSYADWGSPLTAFSAGGTNAFVIKLDTYGARVWHSFIGSTAVNVWGKAIALDSDGNPHLAGYSNGTWGTPINDHTGGSTDAYAAKLNTDGSLQWNTFMGSTDTDEGRAIAVDLSGNVYLAGDSVASWGAPINAYMGNRDAFAAKICASCYTVGTSAPVGEGTFTPTSQTVNDGDTTSFTVNSETGYTIDTVTGCGGTWTDSNPYTTGTISSDCTVTATFILNSYTVSTSAPVDQGSFSPTSQTVTHGSTTTFDINAESGYAIDTVTGCDGTWTGSNPYTTGTISSDCTVTATFLPSYTVSTSAPVGEGSFSPTSRTVVSGSTTTFDINAESGYSIDTVTGCDGTWTGSNPYTTGTISSDCTVTATFLPSFTVSTSAPVGEGSFSPTSRTVVSGSTTTFEVNAETGYTIDTVEGCDGTWTGSNPYTTGTISSDCTVTATFIPNSYTVSTSAPVDQGSFSPTSRTVSHGDTTTFEVNAENGYRVDTVSGCGGTWTGSNPYTTDGITTDCTVTASFTEKTAAFPWILFMHLFTERTTP